MCTEQNTAKCCHVAYGLQSCLYRRHFSCRYLKLILSSSLCILPIFHLQQHLTFISNFFLITCKYLLIHFISNVNKTRRHHLPFPSTSVGPQSYCVPVRKFVFQIPSIHVRYRTFHLKLHSLTTHAGHHIP